ncbi:MAG TPA: replicative DNA helicase [Acidimicrobiales bacterium]|nr:replicative DNA helicase [Acidimicrobiales bacterium]
MSQAFEDQPPRRLQAVGGRVPPHDLDAEESLLGAMLLSRDAIAAALECCTAEDFYKPANAHIFAAVTALYTRGEPADPVTVADELRRSGLIHAVGDGSVLLSLQVNTPSTGNASHYARIVEEHALLRRMVTVASEIAELGYSVPEDVAEVIDRAEALIFDVAQRRVVDTMSPLRELLAQSLDHLEHLFNRGESITGVPTGFADLDERLAGLQKSNLVVVGARPAMGKALALDTPVPTPSGWTTMGELAAGQQVFDERGRPCAVAYTSPVFVGHRCYRVSFDDGSQVVADAGHRWLVHDAGAWDAVQAEEAWLAAGADPDAAPEERARVERCGRVVTTEEMATGAGDRWSVALSGALELPVAELPTDPYRLGLRLAHGAEPMSPLYLRASAKQRLALLQGLVDGSAAASAPTGSDAHRGVALELSPRALAEQVRELACSLGLAPGPLQPVCCGPAGDTAWRVGWVPSRGSGARRVLAVEEVPSVPVRCIAVSSGSHLFLAGHSMVPTHNTSFALGIVAHAAVHARIPVLLFSLEMSHLELTQRLLCSEARVDATRMRNGRLLESDWPKISDAIGQLGDAPIYIDDNPNATVMDIRAKARRLKAREGLGLVVVDYLQLMSGHSKSRAENRQVEVSEISRGLKVLARELEIPVVALSQLSRNLEMRQDKRPVLADLRESGSIEQDSDVVMFIYRDEIYNPDSAERGTAEIIIAKHRNGPTGTTHLAFMDHHTRFANMARV